MCPATLSRIVTAARRCAFDRASDPDRCARIIDKVRARVPRFTPSPRLAAMEAEREARLTRANSVGYMGILKGQDRAFRASRAALDRFNAWEARAVLPLRAQELKAYRASPEVAPYHAAGLC